MTFSLIAILALVLVILAISGFVLLIVLRKRFRFQHLETELEKGTVLSNVIVNPGMLFYIVVFLYLMIAAQLSFSLLNLVLSYFIR